jgi:hypothetical protein
MMRVSFVLYSLLHGVHLTDVLICAPGFLYTICRIHHSISILPVKEDGSLDEDGMTRFDLLP